MGDRPNGTKRCDLEGCDKLAKNGRGRYCGEHHRRFKAYGDPLASAPPKRDPLCVVEHCGHPHRAHGLCSGHLQRYYAHGDPLAGRWSPTIAGHEGDAPLELADPVTERLDPVAPDRAPAVVLRVELALARQHGVSFDQAWASSLKLAGGGGEWQRVLSEHRPIWAAAYDGHAVTVFRPFQVLEATELVERPDHHLPQHRDQLPLAAESL